MCACLGEGATVQQAIDASGLLARFPEIDLDVQKVGVFGKLKPLDTVLADHDRVEIYRLLRWIRSWRGNGGSRRRGEAGRLKGAGGRARKRGKGDPPGCRDLCRHLGASAKPNLYRT